MLLFPYTVYAILTCVLIGNCGGHRMAYTQESLVEHLQSSVYSHLIVK